MKESLKRLDQWLSQYGETVTYGHPLTAKDMQQFESDNKFTLSEDLRVFYHWNSGIKIGNDFEFFSLQEALQIYQNERMKFEPAGTHAKELIDESYFSSADEMRQFQEEEREHTKRITRKTERSLWFPICAQYLPTVTYYYALNLLEIDKESPEWVLITSKTYPKPFYIKITRLYQQRTVYSSVYDFTELPALLSEFQNRLISYKTSFWERVKDFFRAFGSVLDSL